jgi:DNA-binding transcriptional LysR family regulator
MELRQLGYFLAVAEELNFTRAAERIPIAQPAISQQIRRLETELGDRLFVRGRSGVRLTAAGEALLPHARAVLADATRARESVSALGALTTGRLGVGFVLPLPGPLLTGALGAFHRAHPGIDLRLVEDETEPLLHAVTTGRLDVALVGLGRYDRLPAGLASTLLAREPVVAVLPSDHALATRDEVPLRALRDEPMIALTSASRQRATLEAACRSAGFAPRIVAETSDTGTVVSLVREGLGVAVLPTSARADADDGVADVVLVRPRLDRRLLLVWPQQGASAAARAFVALVGAS